MENDISNKLNQIKTWLGTGSINIFGLPMSGKDTQGIRLAESIDGKFLSSGMIIRAMEEEVKKNYSGKGALIPSNLFYEWVLPYFDRKDLIDYPLVLSSIGRWSGEETKVIDTARESGHPIKAALLFNISEAEVEKRFKESKILEDRGSRQDDKDLEIFRTRLKEFREKTIPVIQYYKSQNLLIDINGHQQRDAVFEEIVNKLYTKATTSLESSPTISAA